MSFLILLLVFGWPWLVVIFLVIGADRGDKALEESLRWRR